MKGNLQVPIKYLFYFAFTVFMMMLFANKERLDYLFNPVHQQSIVSNNLPLQLMWSYQPEKAFNLVPAGNSKITVIGNKGQLIALENETGALLWEYEAPGFTSPNIYLDEVNIVGAFGQGNQTYLFKLDTLTGWEYWKVILPAELTRTPDILVIDNIVITAKRSKGGSFIAGYDLQTGKQEWNVSSDLPSTGYSSMVTCSPKYFGIDQPISEALCLIFHDQIFIINSENGFLLEQQSAPFSLNHAPVFDRGKFFASTNVNKPIVQVFDVENNQRLSLPASCKAGRFASSVTVIDSKILVANGCDELYFVSANDLQVTPSWIYHSLNSISSQFVSLDGITGYVLENNAQLTGIDLTTGKAIGNIKTNSNTEMRNRNQINGLYLNPPYLYVVMDEGNLSVLKKTISN